MYGVDRGGREYIIFHIVVIVVKDHIVPSVISFCGIFFYTTLTIFLALHFFKKHTCIIIDVCSNEREL